MTQGSCIGLVQMEVLEITAGNVNSGYIPVNVNINAMYFSCLDIYPNGSQEAIARILYKKCVLT